MFSKSILRALALDGGVGLDNPTRIVDLLDEFSKKSQDISMVQNAAVATGVLAALAGLSGGASIPLVLVSGVLVGGALGATAKHRLTPADSRELALLQRHRSLIHALGSIAQTKGTEPTLARYEELIGTYSPIEDCFYCERTQISAHQVALLLEGIISPKTAALPDAIPPAPKRFSLSQLAKPPRTLPPQVTSTAPEQASASTTPVPHSSSPSPSPNWDADVLAEHQASAPPVWDADTDESAQWMQDLLHYPAVLIYGPQGSGKTTLATWIIHQRQQLGHQVEILDPHREYGQWEGFSVYGDGMDYEAIDQRLVTYSQLVVSRYKQRSQQPTFNPRPLTYLVEEFTQWHRKCRYSGAFFESSLSDTRKINMGVIFVSHGRTLVTLGGAKGLAETRDNSLLEVELLAQVDPVTKKASPTGKGRIKYPGLQPIEMTLPDLSTHTLTRDMKPSSTPPELSSSSSSTAEPTELRRLNEFRTEAELPRTEAEPTPEPDPNLYGVDAKNEAITLQERGLVIETVRSGERNINTILFKVWGVRQGGSKGYAISRQKLNQILKDAGIELK